MAAYPFEYPARKSDGLALKLKPQRWGRWLMQKKAKEKRVLARVLAEELKKVRGGDNPVYETVNAAGRKDITDANSGDRPPI